MPEVHFSELMRDADRHGYAVGYFESWSMESLLAVADAAEAARSPVILGFSGISLPDPARSVREHLLDYQRLGSAVCQRLAVPACLLFNESPDMDWVRQAIKGGFGMVMFSDESLPYDELVEKTRHVAELGHSSLVAVEGECDTLPGLAGDLESMPEQSHMTDPDRAREFVSATSVDCFAINVGQVHLHGREKVRLDQDRVSRIRALLDMPLALHGATSIAQDDIQEAIRRGVRKINVGSILKSTFFEALRASCNAAGSGYNPYEVLGSGRDPDVMTTARVALQKVVEKYMRLFGSANRA